MSKQIIINADDCGMSQEVNNHIERTILADKITSTTILANMGDFDGAIALYNKYKDKISFGWHINLTEGSPLLKSQILLDKQYYIERDGVVFFNGKSFWHSFISRDMKIAIGEELKAQYEKLMDNGVRISHADSHHHIHTSPGLMFFVPSLLEELGIYKMRRMRNYVPYSLNFWIRKFVGIAISMTHPRIKTTDTFCYFSEYFNNPTFPSGNIIEMECHPGHPKYLSEEKLLLSTDIKQQFSADLITYIDFL